MSKILEILISAKVLSVALVLEVGFVIGLYVGKTDSLNAVQWGGAGVALLGASFLAAMVHAWPEPKPAKARTGQRP